MQYKQVIEWQTKNLGMMLAATAMTDKKGLKALMSNVQEMSLFPSDDDQTDDTPKENAPGSYEKLLAGFGGPGG